MAVAEPIVQPRCAALPEFDCPRRDPIAAPVRRSRHVLALRCKALLRRGDLALEPLPVGNDAALRRCPGTETCEGRAGREIGGRILRGPLARHAFDAHLALPLDPVK